MNTDMNTDIYVEFAYLMRYVFVAIIVFIIANILIRSVIESRYSRNIKRIIGLDVRYIKIIAPEQDADKYFVCDKCLTIGSCADCDVSLADVGLKPHHASITIRKGKAVFKTAQRRYCEVNGSKPHRATYLSDGDMVWVKEMCFICMKVKDSDSDGRY